MISSPFPHVSISPDVIAALCERHNIRKLSVFGSVLRDDLREDSGIDVLVEFDSRQPISLFDMGGAQMELSELLGRFVDLKTAGFLSPYFRQKVIDTAQTIYQSHAPSQS